MSPTKIYPISRQYSRAQARAAAKPVVALKVGALKRPRVRSHIIMEWTWAGRDFSFHATKGVRSVVAAPQ